MILGLTRVREVFLDFFPAVDNISVLLLHYM